jgi:intracellular septation protein
MDGTPSVAPRAAPARQVGSRTKAALEFGPIVVFVLGYLVVREQAYVVGGREYDGFVLLVGGFVPLLLGASAVMWRLTGRASPVQLFTLLIVVISGGLTVGLNDERFFKMRTTVVCVSLAAVLWVGLLRGRSYLESVLQGMLTLRPEAWHALTRRLAGFLLALAAANEVVWRGFSTDVWVAYDTFVQPVVFFGFLASQARSLGSRRAEPAAAADRVGSGTRLPAIDGEGGAR